MDSLFPSIWLIKPTMVFKYFNFCHHSLKNPKKKLNERTFTHGLQLSHKPHSFSFSFTVRMYLYYSTAIVMFAN